MLPILTTQGNATGQTGADAPLGKVELDLEGAPFLEPEAPEEPAAKGSLQSTSKTDTLEGDSERQPGKRSKKRLVMLFGALILGLLLIALVAAYMVFLREPGPDPSADYEVVVIPSTPPEMPQVQASKFNISWEPFWVEVADPEGEIRFVYCKIMLVTDNQRVALQVVNKDSTMRDAVYYYLRHKPYSFLADLRQLDLLKSELLSIINYYILPETIIPPDLPVGEAPPPGTPKERLKEILIEEYLIK